MHQQKQHTKIIKNLGIEARFVRIKSPEELSAEERADFEASRAKRLFGSAERVESRQIR